MPVLAVRSTQGIVLSVPPRLVATLQPRETELATALADDDTGVRAARELVVAVGRGDHQLGHGVFRYSLGPPDLEPAGRWVERDDPRVPAWLHPFNGRVLVTIEDDEVVAGVGVKHHDEVGRELAVVTEEAARSRGLARRLVAQAARDVLAAGGIPTYLHGPGNAASARVADAAGFPDHGWSIHSLWPRS